MSDSRTDRARRALLGTMFLLAHAPVAAAQSKYVRCASIIDARNSSSGVDVHWHSDVVTVSSVTNLVDESGTRPYMYHSAQMAIDARFAYWVRRTGQLDPLNPGDFYCVGLVDNWTPLSEGIITRSDGRPLEHRRLQLPKRWAELPPSMISADEIARLPRPGSQPTRASGGARPSVPLVVTGPEPAERRRNAEAAQRALAARRQQEIARAAQQLQGEQMYALVRRTLEARKRRVGGDGTASRQ